MRFTQSLPRAIHSLAALAIALTAVSMALISTPAHAHAAVGTNSIFNFGLWYTYGKGQMCLDSANGNPGTYVTTWACNRGDHQDWAPSIVYSDGSVGLRNKYFAKCALAEFSPYTKVEVYTCLNGTLQRWTRTLIGGSTYVYKNLGRGLCLDVGGTTSGTPVVLKTCNGSTTQEWISTYNGG